VGGVVRPLAETGGESNVRPRQIPGRACRFRRTALGRGDIDVMQQSREPRPAYSPGRRAHTLKVRQQGLPTLPLALRRFRRNPRRPPRFSLAGCPPTVTTPADVAGPPRFRYDPSARDVASDQGGAKQSGESNARESTRS